MHDGPCEHKFVTHPMTFVQACPECGADMTTQKSCTRCGAVMCCQCAIDFNQSTQESETDG